VLELLAGYAGLVSVGQQAFVGLGGYLLFALTIGAGIDPIAAVVLSGLIAAGIRSADGVCAIPASRPLFCDWKLGRCGGVSACVRPIQTARRWHRHVAATVGYQRDFGSHG